MKTSFRHFVLAGILLLAAILPLHAQPGGTTSTFHLPPPATLTASLPSEIKPYPVLSAMQRVADWQLAHPDTNNSPTTWLLGAENAGLMALAGISGSPKYREAALSAGDANDWGLGPRFYDADDYCVGQAYTELYFLYRENRMIAPLRERFNAILATPPDVTSLEFTKAENRDRKNWSWCDSLFMGPPTWVRLYTATGDERYLDFAVTNWWRTTDYLYDKDEHLFFRDSTFFQKREANGKKVFWSRGNGWVIAGLVRVLQYLPTNHPDRPHFEQLFDDMAAKIVILQQPDGLWRASLLDPEDFPAKETSGSGFFTYALAWGVNQGLLDRATYEPAVRKGWAALVDCVGANGKLTHVQAVGGAPATFAPDSTKPYGVGAFLLAGSEVYRMAVLEKAQPEPQPAPPGLDGKPIGGGLSLNRQVQIKVTNPAGLRRDCETVELTRNSLPIAAATQYPSWAVMDGLSSRILDSQAYSEETNSLPDKLLFQVDLAPHETRTYYILDASALAVVPPPIVKTSARYVPERHDDFAWESDRIAHRMFGKALETWQEEPLTSSGVDVWIKRTRQPVVNEMYRTMNFFNLSGPSQDDFKVGKTRGDGGLGIWQDGKLYVSKNWRTYKIITTGPIRSEFELTYDAWDAGNGRTVSETKRIRIDAGSNLDRVESTFRSEDKSPLTIGVGLAERPGDNVIVPDGSPEIDSWPNGTAHGLVVQNQTEGWMTYWQPRDFEKGTTGTAFILPKGSVETFTNDAPNLPASAFKPPTHTMKEGQPAIRDFLAVAPAEIGKPFTYYFGAGWSESGDFPDARSWTDYVRRFAERRDQPLQVAMGK
ncbi:MAG TPA: glycoside hydrolase family 88 protein [Candidatus Acidoferrales bacterium]|nr:glycoside hydrolase family 88 protein [Candidatus Acidoferrales bacterium]